MVPGCGEGGDLNPGSLPWHLSHLALTLKEERASPSQEQLGGGGRQRL